MKPALAIVVAAMLIALTGCVLKGKPAVSTPTPVLAKAAPPPPAPAPSSTPLSERQTRVDLPAPQPITQEARNSAEPAGEPPAPDPPPVRTTRKRDTTKKQDTPPATPPAAAAPPAEPEPRAPIQEIVSPEDLVRLQAGAAAKKHDIRQLLARVSHRQTKETKDAVDTIQTFVRLSDEAERAGDMRKAFELADRGLVLAQTLSNAK